MNNSMIEKAAPGTVLRDEGRGSVQGLHLKVTATGSKAFYLYYRTQDGQQRRPKVGDAGAITLTQAREIARGWLARVYNGEDPSLDRQESRQSADTRRTVADAYSACLQEHWSLPKYVQSGWKREVERLWERSLKKAFGDHLLPHVDAPLVRTWLAGFESKPTEGNRARGALSTLFKYCEEKGWRSQNTNPCALVKPFPKRKRSRYAKPEEIQKIGEILAREEERHPATVAYLYLLMFTGSRPSSIERATWDQIRYIEHKGQTFAILERQGKTGEETVILPPQAVRVLQRLPRVPGGTITGRKMPQDFWEKVRKEAGCPDLWARDWRRTFGTLGVSSGMSREIIGELQNHKSPQTMMIYQKAMEGAKLDTAAAIATRLEALAKGAALPGEPNGGVVGPKDGDQIRAMLEQADPNVRVLVHRVLEALGLGSPTPGLNHTVGVDHHGDVGNVRDIRSIKGK